MAYDDERDRGPRSDRGDRGPRGGGPDEGALRRGDWDYAGESGGGREGRRAERADYRDSYYGGEPSRGGGRDRDRDRQRDREDERARAGRRRGLPERGFDAGGGYGGTLPLGQFADRGPDRDRDRGGARGLDRLPQRGAAPGSHAGKGPRGYTRTDDRIHEDVCDALMRDHDVDASDVEVRVEQGEVTLAGTVEDRLAKRRAEELADSCAGVRDVHNELRIAGRD